AKIEATCCKILVNLHPQRKFTDMTRMLPGQTTHEVGSVASPLPMARFPVMYPDPDYCGTLATYGPNIRQRHLQGVAVSLLGLLKRSQMERVVTLPPTDDFGYYDDPQIMEMKVNNDEIEFKKEKRSMEKEIKDVVLGVDQNILTTLAHATIGINLSPGDGQCVYVEAFLGPDLHS
ncbi:hypothetical protein Tco_0979808, partial [Tanacetum coccineum]